MQARITAHLKNGIALHATDHGGGACRLSIGNADDPEFMSDLDVWISGADADKFKRAVAAFNEIINGAAAISEAAE